MAVTEVSGLMKYKDANGNVYLMLPITTKDNVDGMEEIDAHLVDNNNPHGVTAAQIGAAPEDHDHTVSDITDIDNLIAKTLLITTSYDNERGGTYTDKTFDEILTAISEDKLPVLIYGSMVYNIKAVYRNRLEFTAVDGSMRTIYSIAVDTTGKVTATDVNFANSDHTHNTFANDLTINKANPAFVANDTNNGRSAEVKVLGSGTVRFANEKPGDSLNFVDIRLDKETASLADLLKLYVTKNDVDSEYRLYGEHNKPTASDVGADVFGSAANALTDSKSYTDTKIADLINGAPATLDTLSEIATAMADNEDVVETLESAIGNKVSKSGDTMTGSLVIDGTAAFDGTSESIPNMQVTHSGYEGIVRLSSTGNVQLVKSTNGTDKAYLTLTDNGPVFSKPLKPNSGGTGLTKVTAGNFVVGNGSNALVEKTPAEVLAAIEAIPTTRKVNGKALSGDITLSASDVDAASASTHQIATYTALSQIGLTSGSETLESIAAAMPDNSILQYAVESGNTDVYPDDFGRMEVRRADADTVVFYFNTTSGWSPDEYAETYVCHARVYEGEASVTSWVKVFDGGSMPVNIFYGEGAGDQASQYKTVTISQDGFALKKGVTIAVKFNNQNTTAAPMLDVNGTGDIPVKQNGSVDVGSMTWVANQVVLFTYDGTNWLQHGAVRASVNGRVGPTSLSSATNSTAEDVAATPKAVKAAYDLANGAMPVIVATSNSYDMDTILKSGGHYALYKTSVSTLGTPYKYGIVSVSNALILSYAPNGTYGTQIAYTSGAGVYMRNLDNGTIRGWVKIPTINDVPSTTENWIFTLEDGSTVTKAVYVG